MDHSVLQSLLEEYRVKGYDVADLVPIKSGKEATVYFVESGGVPYALKVYKDPERRAFQKNHEYLEGQFYRRHSFRKAIAKKNKFGKKLLHQSWVKREFGILRALNERGASVPTVYDWTPTSILMEFIGDDGVPASRLVDVALGPDEAEGALGAIMESVELFLKIGVVHSDLSAYNILWWKGKPYVIDFPQAVDVRNNPNTAKLLQRDIDNVKRYFEQHAST